MDNIPAADHNPAVDRTLVGRSWVVDWDIAGNLRGSFGDFLREGGDSPVEEVDTFPHPGRHMGEEARRNGVATFLLLQKIKRFKELAHTLYDRHLVLFVVVYSCFHALVY